MKAAAVVVAASNNQVRVRLLARSGCGRCAEPGGCGAVQLTQVFGNNDEAAEFALAVQPGEHFVAGDKVSVHISRAGGLAAMWLGYGWALLLLIGGALCGQWLAPASQAGAIIGAGSGLLLAWWTLRVLMRQPHWQRWWQHHGQMRLLREEERTPCQHS